MYFGNFYGSVNLLLIFFVYSFIGEYMNTHKLWRHNRELNFTIFMRIWGLSLILRLTTGSATIRQENNFLNNVQKNFECIYKWGRFISLQNHF